MRTLQEQFDEVRRSYSGAHLQAAPDGTQLVVIPDVPLPAGWSQNATHVRFTIPTGYPYAVPDCFWSDGGLRLASAQMPQNAVQGQITPGQPDGSLLWFSWHVTANCWNPAQADLMTYVKVILRRFEAPQ